MRFQAGTEDVVKELGKSCRFICFGYGAKLKTLCENTGITRLIDAVADNNDALWNTSGNIDNQKISLIGPEEIKKYLTEKHVLLITTTYYKQVQDQLCRELAIDLDIVYYFPSERDVKYEKYAELHAGEPLKDIIVFRSGLAKYVEGFDFSDNAKAMFEYMLDRGYHKKYQMIWMVKYPEAYLRYDNIENVEFVSYEWESEENKELSDKYFHAMYFAKYFFFTDTHFWLRHCRTGQLRINLWHGCGLKDRKTKNGPCRKSYDFMTVNSDTYAEIHAGEFGCDREQMLVTGLAKQDWLFRGVDLPLAELLGIPRADKYIFWLPTFRMAAEGLERLNEYILDSETGLPIVTTDQKMTELDGVLKSLNMTMLIKLHPVQDNSLIAHKSYSNIAVVDNKTLTEMDLHINSLLAQAAAIISDYSSVAIDFLLLDRPIGFALDDLKKYEESRGFVFNPIKEYLPGKEIYDFDQFIDFIKEVSQGNDSSRIRRNNLLSIFHAFNNGNNCERILESVGIKI
ncbi:CDP-glycerol glycerophosphotransferase family protein [Desulfitobacterium hafniense]|uniref:CDP-glycerol glycerophosphotransferase family protein n=1 Tax=Desulfitobacterium hafniense TaxID=49338 RepID=UPI00035DEDC3|nr:CDP-glycerol glycerophosphotransferase family protein [Desulfitobacterium hafniense]